MNTPKIRFKGFTDDWEQRKLRENLSFLKDGTHGTHKDVEDGPLLLSAKNIKNGTVQWDESDRRISEDEFKSIHANFKLKEGDVLLTIVGSIGETAILNNSEGITFQRSVAFLRPASKIISEFLYSEIQGYKFQKELNERKSTSAQPGIYLSDLGEIPISYPINMDEQVAIGHYFTNIDHLIALHQRKCDETKQLKKFMLQKMFPKNGEKNPEIRFEGFTDDWEQRKLGDVLICLQNNTFSRADLSNETGVAKNVHYGDVLVKFGEVLDVSKEQLPMISDERVLIKYKASFLQNGDVIVADTAEDSTVGKCSEIAGLNNEIVLSGLHTIPYRPKEKFASGYLGYYLNSDSYHNQLIPLMQGIKVTSISKSALRNTDIIYPESKEEQAKIGNYFQSLDNLITLHQRKCEKLKELKKYMLRNMFI
jgi:type I restriction enzyme S subunit